MKTISIAIPAYEFSGKGVEFIEDNFKIFERQTFKDFDVVISDHSKDDLIKELCERWSNNLDIKWYRNELNRGSASANTQNSIDLSAGKFIKLLCGDDYLFDEHSLQNNINYMTDDKNWGACEYLHTQNKVDFFRHHVPAYNDRIQVHNTIGTPSCVIIRNLPDMPRFDLNLFYAYDCDWYRRFNDKFGGLVVINEISMVNYLWEGSTTSKFTQEMINKELDYIRRKYEP